MFSYFSDYGMLLELFAAAVLFCWWLEKRAHFAVRVAVSVCCGAITVRLFGAFQNSRGAWIDTFLYVALCFIGILLLQFCFRGGWRQAVFHMTAVCTAQHLAYKLATIFLSAVSLAGETREWTGYFLYALFFTIFILATAAVFATNIKKEENSQMSGGLVLLILVGMLLFTSLFQNLFREYSMDIPVQLQMVFEAFDLICCIFLLSLQCEVCRRARVEQDNDLMKHLLHQQKEQMETSRETIDLINIKYHDLKHYLSRLEDKLSLGEVRELEDAVSVYGTTVKTGNDAVDVVLAEKLILCEKAGIRLDCMLDGSSLSFMNPVDIYALLGNILDNAMEAARKLPESARRVIEMKIRHEKGMTLVHCENAYEGTVQFNGELPETSKEDKKYHGYGMKSIRYISEKYGGYLTVRAQKGIFVLDILLPVKERVMD